MTVYWFAHNNRVTLADTDFLESVGITIDSPRGWTTYEVDEPTGAIVGCLGWIFVSTTGAVIVRPHHQITDRGIVKLLRTAVDCVERDLHLRESWKYYRKTSKRPGRWAGHMCASLARGSELAQEVKALDMALKSYECAEVTSQFELSE